MGAPFKYRIVVEWSDEDRAFVARVPAWPALAAHGASPQQAADEARVAAEGMLAVLREDGDAPPLEDAAADASGNIRLRLPRQLHRQLAAQADAEGVSLNQLMVSILALGAGSSIGAAIGRAQGSGGKATAASGRKGPRRAPAAAKKKRATAGS